MNDFHPTRGINISIELLRGVAAVMVMLCHYAVILQGTERGWLNFFYTGVDFFFVISGFVFAPTLLAPARENAAAFAIRRVFRIYPLFLAAIVFYALLPHKTWDNSIILQHALFLHTTVSKEIAFYYNPAFWSLPVEMEFYMLIALCVLLRIRSTAFIMLFLFGFSLLAGLMAHQFLPADSHTQLVLSHHLPTILPEFLLGTLAYQISRKCARLPGLVLGVAGLVLLFMLGQGFVTHGDTMSDLTYGQFNLLCALGYQLILIAAVVLFSPARADAPLSQLASALGNLSYGIYLFHNAIPPLLNHFFQLDGMLLFTGSILGTLCIAAVMYNTLENPARNYGRHFARQLYRPE
ncbi:acyltransferase family protein [Nitrosomonas marina]|uniref:Peptidoglycan/LPS O-acetylase OafA/YrhL, contains acyltransferase and SGNH-hydrolase domains n=1 Tax=Nitrosomonas marina TaxID=917 RepID=A0A1H8D9K4_9PROT|nr:acyltransferase [Nitrosomonas marina]SEN03795.1 Peptidoglycan/LPS O-acetylase OafA/YrhL, contains acyltransferase and SGNH-hydrolase domains [Nitrosomonas marina]